MTLVAAGGGTVSDTMHIAFSMVTSLLMLLAMAFGAAALGKQFRFYSIVTILVLIIFGSVIAMDAPKLAANLPTPMLGVWERILIGAFLLWIIVLAALLLRKETKKEQTQAQAGLVNKKSGKSRSLATHH